MRKSRSTFRRYNSAKHSVAPHHQSSHSVKERIEKKYEKMPPSQKSAGCPQCMWAVWNKQKQEAEARGSPVPERPKGAGKKGHVNGCDHSLQDAAGVKSRNTGGSKDAASGLGGEASSSTGASNKLVRSVHPFGKAGVVIPNEMKKPASLFAQPSSTHKFAGESAAAAAGSSSTTTSGAPSAAAAAAATTGTAVPTSDMGTAVPASNTASPPRAPAAGVKGLPAEQRAEAYLADEFERGWTQSSGKVPLPIYCRTVKFAFECAVSLAEKGTLKKPGLILEENDAFLPMRYMVTDFFAEERLPSSPDAFRNSNRTITEGLFGRTVCPCGSDNVVLRYSTKWDVPMMSFMQKDSTGVITISHCGRSPDDFGFDYQARCLDCSGNPTFYTLSQSALVAQPPEAFIGPRDVAPKPRMLCPEGATSRFYFLAGDATDQLRREASLLSVGTQHKSIVMAYREREQEALFAFRRGTERFYDALEDKVNEILSRLVSLFLLPLT